MLTLRKLGELDLAAASGLVAAGGRLYVVADDELALAVYDRATLAPRRRIVLFPGDLPEGYEARKAAKPDLEALALMPDGSLLALGSGSRPNRRRGVRVTVDPDAVRPIDLAPLYVRLDTEFTELNIEGAAALPDGGLRLFQRKAGPRGENAIIDVDPGLSAARAIRRVALPELAGVPLGFTDASPLADGRIAFAAAAEATTDAYADGPCAGSAVGLLAPDGRLLSVTPLAGHAKIEGLHAELGGDGGIDLLLVADADDRRVPAPVFAARLTP